MGHLLETATTLDAITQLAIWQTIHPIQRLFCTKVMQLCYPRLGGHRGRFYIDTFFVKTSSLGDSKMAHVYTNYVPFTKTIPVKAKAEAPLCRILASLHIYIVMIPKS